MRELSTLEVQDLNYKKRLRRLEMTKGLSPREMISRVNARPSRIKQATGPAKGRMNRAAKPAR